MERDAPPATSGTATADIDDVNVLYIAGIGRSGSTLLCRTLGSVAGFLGTGELMRFLGRGVISGDHCSCGAPVGECGFWSVVLRDLLQREPDLDLERLEHTRKRITEGWEFLRHMFLPNTHTALGRDLVAYRRFLTALYRSIASVSQAPIIIDASKNLFFAMLLAETRGVRVTVLHLVRDSRGVAHSLGRKRERPGTNGRREYFRQQGPLLGSILWNAAHVWSERIGKRTGRIVRVRYEDFVANPTQTMNSLLLDLGAVEAEPRVTHINGASVRLGVDHLIASNPNRSQRGDIPLREDAAWREEMTAGRRWLVTGLTFPLLRRYGYPILGTPSTRPAPGRIVTEQPEP
jgi:hypothetical protein